MTTLRDTSFILHLADNALILGQRNAEWCGHGPVLEEDIAMANISLDLIGQARLLYQLAGRREDKPEDYYAYWRSEAEFRNFTLCELPHSGAPQSGNSRVERDYAVTIVRNFFFSAYMALLWRDLANDADAELAAIAAKSAKETSYHLRHAADWLVRMGDGTTESHQRAQRAVDLLYPYTEEFWLKNSDLQSQWRVSLQEYLLQATLTVPDESPTRTANFIARSTQGIHSEHMGYLLAEMQSVARAHPGATW
jgi:ring-1,2-phenylacetyl-CoA epoxidase subunit PaaC